LTVRRSQQVRPAHRRSVASHPQRPSVGRYTSGTGSEAAAVPTPSSVPRPKHRRLPSPRPLPLVRCLHRRSRPPTSWQATSSTSRSWSTSRPTPRTPTRRRCRSLKPVRRTTRPSRRRATDLHRTPPSLRQRGLRQQRLKTRPCLSLSSPRPSPPHQQSAPRLSPSVLSSHRARSILHRVSTHLPG
jgi:hypothetical protein